MLSRRAFTTGVGIAVAATSLAGSPRAAAVPSSPSSNVFAPLKTVVAGDLVVGYAEEGPVRRTGPPTSSSRPEETVPALKQQLLNGAEATPGCGRRRSPRASGKRESETLRGRQERLRRVSPVSAQSGSRALPGCSAVRGRSPASSANNANAVASRAATEMTKPRSMPCGASTTPAIRTTHGGGSHGEADGPLWRLAPLGRDGTGLSAPHGHGDDRGAHSAGDSGDDEGHRQSEQALRRGAGTAHGEHRENRDREAVQRHAAAQPPLFGIRHRVLRPAPVGAIIARGDTRAAGLWCSKTNDEAHRKRR